MITLAIDFAWRESGWVVVDVDGSVISYGIISTKPRKRKNKSDRDITKTFEHEKKNFDYILNSISGIISKFNCGKVIAEVPYFSQKASDAILIGMGWAILKTVGAEFYTASQVKDYLCGSKSASKSEVALEVYKKVSGLLFKESHIIDAYAVYLASKNPFVKSR